MAMVNVTPEVTVTAEHRSASSTCCGAKLALGPAEDPEIFICTRCLEPCGRVLGEPRVVAVHG